MSEPSMRSGMSQSCESDRMIEFSISQRTTVQRSPIEV